MDGLYNYTTQLINSLEAQILAGSTDFAALYLLSAAYTVQGYVAGLCQDDESDDLPAIDKATAAAAMRELLQGVRLIDAMGYVDYRAVQTATALTVLIEYADAI